MEGGRGMIEGLMREGRKEEEEREGGGGERDG